MNNIIKLDDKIEFLSQELLLNIFNDKIKNYIQNYFKTKIFIIGNQIHIENKEKLLPLYNFLLNLESKMDMIGSDLDIYKEFLHYNLEYDEKEFNFIKNAYFTLYPRNFKQGLLIKKMQNNSLVFATGPAGTGKTFIAIAYALNELLNKNKTKLILSRPVVNVGESLGFLPGNIGEKLDPYLKPLFDAIDELIPSSILKRIMEKKQIEIIPLAYMRGRSLNNSFIILDEAQNTTEVQMKMFLTRIGKNTNVIINGDLSQKDIKINSGLKHASSILKGIKDIDILEFDKNDIVRSELVKKIIFAYDNYKNDKYVK